jgi:hypothetical protein
MMTNQSQTFDKISNKYFQQCTLSLMLQKLVYKQFFLFVFPNDAKVPYYKQEEQSANGKPQISKQVL